MARLDELRLMTRVARLYHESGLRQPAIARRLALSQSTISRLLQRAGREGIVRVTISVPSGVFPELEEAVRRRYGLQEAIVVDSYRDEEEAVMRDLGAAAAYYLETTTGAGEVVGVDSYASLRWMVDALRPPAGVSGTGAAGGRLVQLSGGVGDPASEEHHTHLTRRLAALMRAEAVSLPAPGLAPSVTARRVFAADPYVRQAVALFDAVTVALLGIGTTAPPLPTVGFLTACTPAEREALTAAGIAGFLCHRFFDAAGAPVTTALDERITAISREQLQRVPRRVGISGGRRRLDAIRAALSGGWITVLITDRFTAARLVASPPNGPLQSPPPQGEAVEAVP